MGYLLFADSHTYVCRTWNALAARLVWAGQEGCADRAQAGPRRPPGTGLALRYEKWKTLLAVSLGSDRGAV